METIQGKPLQEGLEKILANYLAARARGTFGRSHDLWSVFESLERAFAHGAVVGSRQDLKVSWSMGQGNWAKVPWIAFLDSRETNTTRYGIYCCYLFRQDMSGVYLTYNQGVTELINKRGRSEARDVMHSKAEELRGDSSRLTEHGFSLDDNIDLRSDSSLAAEYEHSTIAYKLYEAGAVPTDRELLQDLEAVLRAYDTYLRAQHSDRGNENHQFEAKVPQAEFPPPETIDLDSVESYIAQKGFVFEPWQIAAYVTALRTKPFVILAGVSGTGKSKLPQLVADATGAECTLLPVRPNWTDSSDVLGYQDLQGHFRPGSLLQFARTAEENPSKHHICIIDEMNLARVEYYFAEVLSRMEDRDAVKSGGYGSRPLLNLDLAPGESHWAKQGLPPNLAIVGTVNMDETTHSFSRKVLDRAFTLEFSSIDLINWERTQGQVPVEPVAWQAFSWCPRAVQIAELHGLTADDHDDVDRVVTTLHKLNTYLVQAQLQVGYRTRDEAALFVLHARELSPYFVTRNGAVVDPLDLVLHMKVLPRIVGGSNAIRRLLLQLLGWAHTGTPFDQEEQAKALREVWTGAGCPTILPDAKFPQTAARLCLMWDRLDSEGFTSFWL